ncbi:MAG: hypothetical protein LBG58_03250 [Planctomycetaceae bacterium]|jgi:hypothetical protein|nr:hypothetical protein [Planctomycetaceae bacterium]
MMRKRIDDKIDSYFKNGADHFQKRCGTFSKMVRIIFKNGADHFLQLSTLKGIIYGDKIKENPEEKSPSIGSFKMVPDAGENWDSGH